MQIQRQDHGAVALLTLDDPASMNAVTPDDASALADAIMDAQHSARAILLTGSGRAFCSGANLAAPQLSHEGGPIDVGDALETHYNPLMHALRDCRVPLVTAVNGAAAGIGASIALMGDLILASKDAYFLQAFRRIGLVPDGGATYLLTRAIGRARAMELMLLGEKLPAETALAWGLINRVAAPEDLLTQALEIAQNLANGPTRALKLIRMAAWVGLDARWETQLQRERLFQRDAGQSADFAEGVAAFFQKRPANFSGD